MIPSSPSPPPAHEDSRRLPGPNRWLDRPAVVLQALGAAARDDAALARWAARVQRLCAALGWPAPAPQVQRHAQGTVLAFAAPLDALLTATEVNEWAWERSAAEAGALAAEGRRTLQPATDELATLLPHFRRLAAGEASPPLQRLRAAAATRGLPCFEDDDSLSIGAGCGSACWPRAALPLPMDVPWTRLHDIPTVLVTGSNGKTTTTRLLAAIATAAGRTPGLCSTEGVWVAGQPLHSGDWAGPAGARAVLRDARVQLALLETARGGILRRGLAVRRADAAVITNVCADHLGEYGIDSVEDIARAKATVLQALAGGGLAVLNAADPVLMALALPRAQAVPGARLALFAPEHAHPLLAAHRAAGGSTCGASQGRLLLHLAGTDHALGEMESMPLLLGGAAVYNLENVAAAALAAQAAGLPLAVIAGTLQRFGRDPQDNPGRLERWDWQGATVLLDYAHNPDGLAQLLAVAQALRQPRAGPAGTGRLGLLLGQAGNRNDAALAELARAAARFAPERVVLKELPAMLRGRMPGEVPALLQRELLAAGLPAEQCARIDDEAAAARALLQWARPADVLVLPVHTQAARQAVSAWLQAGALPACPAEG